MLMDQRGSTDACQRAKICEERRYVPFGPFARERKHFDEVLKVSRRNCAVTGDINDGALVGMMRQATRNEINARNVTRGGGAEGDEGRDIGGFPAHLSQTRDAEENMHCENMEPSNMEDFPKGGSARPRKAKADACT